MIDLAVIGGGPVGLVTALAARRAGFDVTVFDRQQPPIDKACGEGLMPEGVAVLERLGVERPEGVRFRGIRYLDGEVTAEGRFPAGRHGLGVRRPALHGALVRCVEEAGVDLRWGIPVHGLAEGGLVTAAGPVASRWIAAADGLGSPTRRRLGARVDRGPVRRFGLRRHFRVEPWSDCVEVQWADGAEAYITPVGAKEIGVAMLWRGEGARFEALVGRFPQLRERLQGAEQTSRDRGSGPLWQRPKQLVWGNLALVGDAAGYIDAITGEGMALGFRQAEILIACLATGRLEEYPQRSRSLVAWPFRLIRALLAVERRPRLRHRVVSALASKKGLFSELLAAHVSCRRPPAGAVLRLAHGVISG